jgi:hypothetical protein
MFRAIHSACRSTRGSLRRPLQTVVMLCLSGAVIMVGSAHAGDVGELALFSAQIPARADALDPLFANVEQPTDSRTTVGFDFASADGSMALSDASESPTVALSVTLTAPGPGFIEVDFSTALSIGHALSSSSYVVCALRTDTASPETADGRLPGSRQYVHVPTGSASTTYYPHIDSASVLAVDAARSVTIHAVCYRSTPTTSGALVYRSLAATYHPARF